MTSTITLRAALLKFIRALMRQGNWKYVLDTGSDVEKQRWLACVNRYGATNEQDDTEMVPEPE